MKLIALLILVSCFKVTATVHAQSISIFVKQEPIEKVFEKIQKQSRYSFFYDENILCRTGKVTLSLKNKSLTEVLDKVFKDQPLVYEVIDQTILVKPKEKGIIEQISDFLKKQTVTGTVTDENNQALAGATVTVKGTGVHTGTNSEGKFTLHNVTDNAVLLVTYIGYITQEVSVKNAGKIILIKSESKLDEVQVIAYGTTTKRLNTGSVAKISAKEIESQPVSNLLATMIGRVPGADVIQNNGVPGSTFSIQIRGRNSLAQGSEPLFIIDGVPFAPNNNNIAVQNSVSNGLSPFSSINPNDIESIEVLKDADATAIYGSRGANGVVLISTKKGKSGATRFNVRHLQGYSDIAKKMNMLTTEQYLALREEAFRNDNITPSSAPGTEAYAPDLLLWDKNRYTDLRDLIMGQTASTMNSAVNLSGGDNRTQFLIGGSFNRESTVFTGDSRYKKGTINLNINHKALQDRLEIAFSTNYSLESNRLFNGNALYYSNLPPNLPQLYNADGDLNWSQDGASFYNPVAFTKKEFSSYRKNLISRMQVSYSLLNNLNIKTSFGYNDLNADERSYDPLSTQDPSGDDYEGFAQYSTNSFSSWIIEPQIDYSIKRQRGSLHFTLGASLQSTLNEVQSLKASGYSSDQLLKSLAAATILSNQFNSYAPYKYAAAFARINYNLDNKYLINLSGRRDGSSRFGSDNQWGNFYAIGAGWIFSNENFLSQKNSILSFGKLRTSYGITGNDQIGNYQYLDTWSTWRPYQRSTALYPSSLFNPNYGWEVNKKYEAALETAWLNERIFLNIAFFLNRSDNQLVQYILPSQTGHFSINRNFPALIENKGWESELTIKIFKNQNFQWETGFNITIPKNRLLRFENLQTSAYQSKYVIGESLNVMYGYRSLGVDPQIGVYEFQDTNGDGTINNFDYAVLGTLDPKFYGGWSNTLKYKGFSISAFFQFKKQTGTTILNEIYSNSQSFPGMMFNQPSAVMARWKNPGDITTVQKVSATTSSEAYRIANEYVLQSNAVLGDASFIRLKTLELSYNLPTLLSKKIAAGSCNLFIQGQNLLTITRYNGWDPETQGNILAVPPLRSLTLGIALHY
ncbi:SusC/RagA family TonB-linked outer membrane protein [Chryseobacterium lathyri]|uniref:SusC/RagA family TonB-linked outer membrane protein n=2 Tax=Chryseobacterium lathyri TaxID=395933 RepID=A0A511Y7J5_9FLAO|nr:SusC/RagA family TonB-linked outer membrane protein [Chryseobacterium lathyri]GEN71171.1 SusC/RagA family TonB-linked outer membrane protein [Chryseobacterium lathyri]